MLGGDLLLTQLFHFADRILIPLRQWQIPNGKLIKQAQRYNTYYGGQGAFVFGQGYCADLGEVVSDAMLLDATPLDITAVTNFQNAS